MYRTPEGETPLTLLSLVFPGCRSLLRVYDDALDPKQDPPVYLPAYSLGTLLPRGPPSCNGVVQWRKSLAGRGEQP